ncbi:MAG: metal-dependent hydrolase [Pelagibacterium sp. SCN 64-44]|nr:MAG: metal-dependent hydrolase [Pelagibacterium sp. SCN 64-44]
MQIHYLGHSAFKVSIEGAVLLFDPFLTGNPKFTGARDAMIADVTHVLLTHGHNDHFGDTLDILARTDALLIANPELCHYVQATRPEARVHAMNYGGKRDFGPFSVAMVPAWHSSVYNAPDGRTIPAGNPAGLVITAGGHRLYHMGDTSIFSDMALINELHRPNIGLVPIGDNFTMGPNEAALAVNRYFDFDLVIPCHYATFGLLEPSADGFAAKVEKSRVEIMAPMTSIGV